MAAERNLTPEKQLLKLIEDPQAKSAPRIEAKAIKYQSQSLLSAGAWLGRFAFLKERFRAGLSVGANRIDAVQVINVALGIAVAVLAAYFVLSMASAVARQRSLKPVEITFQPASQTATSTVLSRLQDASYYLERIASRNIFKIGARKNAESQDPQAVSKAVDLAKNLRLVGISWSDDPDAMIEDTQLKRTFFIKKGQMIGELVVKEITKDKVVVAYQGENTEVR